MPTRGFVEEPGDVLGPRRGEERRAALAVLELANRMVEQPMARLMQMPVSDDMLAHIAAAQKISAPPSRQLPRARIRRWDRGRASAGLADSVRVDM